MSKMSGRSKNVAKRMNDQAEQMTNYVEELVRRID